MYLFCEQTFTTFQQMKSLHQSVKMAFLNTLVLQTRNLIPSNGERICDEYSQMFVYICGAVDRSTIYCWAHIVKTS